MQLLLEMFFTIPSCIMESTFASRVKQFRADKQLSQTAFGERCGLTQGNIAHMEGGKEPLQTNVSKLIVGFPDLNPDWLLLGTGPMLHDGKAYTPATQLPPPVPSKYDPTRTPDENGGAVMGVLPYTIQELREQNDVLRRENAAKDARIATLEENQGWLRQEVSRKTEASSDAADLYEEADAIANEHTYDAETNRMILRVATQYREGRVSGSWIPAA